VEALNVVLYNWDTAYQRFQEIQPLKKKKRGDKKSDEILSSADARDYLAAIRSTKVQTPNVRYQFGGSSAFGRRYAVGNSLQCMQRSLRHTLGSSLYFDIDIKNCHPTILFHWCKEKNLVHPVLEEYVRNRDGVFEVLVNAGLRRRIGELRYADEAMSKEDLKEGFLSMINGGSELITVPPNDMIKRFFTDHTRVMDAFCNDHENKKYVDRAKEKLKSKKAKATGPVYENVKGSAMNLYFCSVEDSIMCIAEQYLKRKGIRIGTLCFDGALIYKEDVHQPVSTSFHDFLISDFIIPEFVSFIVLSRLTSFAQISQHMYRQPSNASLSSVRSR